MADVNRGDRPLSPHVSIYQFQITWVLSILHRITGVALMLGAGLLVWWLAAAASGPEAFAVADGFLSGWLGGLILIGSALALGFHFLNGVRHLIWDAGYGFDLRVVTRTGWLTVAGAVALAALMVAAAWL